MAEIDQLREASLFSNLSDDQLKAVLERGEQRRIPEGEDVFAQGSTGDEVYVLLDGRVQITMEMSRASEQAPVHTVTPGHVFGEFALIAGDERSATARAAKDVTCFVLSREAFRALAEVDPQLGYKVLSELCQVLVGRIVKTTQELRSSLMF